MRALLMCAMTFGLAACGGSDSDDLTERHALRAEASAWENRMPMIISPDQPPTCTSLIVRFSIVGDRVLPADLTATTVVLSKNGVPVWTQATSAQETGLNGASTLGGVARGCATSALREGDQIDVRIAVKTSSEASEVIATTRLTAAY